MDKFVEFGKKYGVQMVTAGVVAVAVTAATIMIAVASQGNDEVIDGEYEIVEPDVLPGTPEDVADVDPDEAPEA